MTQQSPGEVLRRLLYLVRRDRYTADLEEEMRLHRELRARQLQGGGLAPDAARYAARRKFGNITHHQERSRDMWGFDWISNAADDFRFAIRRLRNRPAFALSTIAVAALGIGATTAVFSAIDAAILRPLPFHRPEQLVTLPSVNIPFDRGQFRARNGQEPAIPVPDLVSLRAAKDIVTSIAAYAAGGLNLEDAAAPRRVKVGVVTANFFETLGVVPARGRVFSADEGKPGGPRAAILSNAIWRGQYGGGDVIGRKITLHGNRYEIVGVMPARFGFPAESDIWIPMSVPTTPETFQPFRGYLPSKIVARMAPGVTAEVASRRLLALWERARPPKVAGRKYPIDERIDELRATGAAIPLQQDIVGGRRKAFLILLGATVLLLLIAAANVANLLLSDGAARRREVALREVLGASRGRVVRQLMVESIVLALSGAVIGVILAPLALGLMRALMPEALLGTAPIHVDLRVLLFATALALVTGTVFGLWPALGASRVDAHEAIKSGGGHGATAGRLGATRRILITAEVALTVMLLVGAGLMLKSFRNLMTQDFGMRTADVGTLELTFARPGAAEVSLTGTAAQRSQMIRTVLDRLSADPQISAVGVVNDLPLRGGGGIGISIEADGMPAPSGDRFPRYLIASGGYFKAMGIPLLRGRTFEASDDTIGQRAAVISQSMAKVYWPGTDPIGRTFTFGGDTAIHYAVVGVVADVREGRVDDEPGPQMYFSSEERALSNLGLVARSTLPPAQLLARLNAAIRQVAPTQAVFNLRMMDEVVSSSVAPRRTNTVLIAIFGGLALLLSAFGVYAVVSYSVTQRAREFGIRSALGAARSDILALVGRDMGVMLALGVGIGLAGAWALSRVLASMLYGVEAHDVSTYIIAPAVLLVPAAIAMLVPAARAMSVSPTEVMRAE